MKARIGKQSIEIDPRRLPVAVRVLPGGVIPYKSALRGSPWAPFGSKLEADYDKQLLLEQRLGAIQRYWHHPVSMNLGGGDRIIPDFLVWDWRGLCFHEVKGHHPNLRASLKNIRLAATVYPCYRWVIVRRAGRRWHEEEVQP